jgi:hypothetical protein
MGCTDDHPRQLDTRHRNRSAEQRTSDQHDGQDRSAHHTPGNPKMHRGGDLAGRRLHHSRLRLTARATTAFLLTHQEPFVEAPAVARPKRSRPRRGMNDRLSTSTNTHRSMSNTIIITDPTTNMRFPSMRYTNCAFKGTRSSRGKSRKS